MRAALGKSALGYTESLGIPSLRARIARHYAETYRVPVSADRVIVTTGSSAGFILAFLSMFEPGDRVAIANPGYPPYRHILTALGCEPVLIETDAATRFAITGESLRAAHAKKAACRRAGGKPGQSDRHHDDAAGARRADPRGGRGRHSLHLRRNLSRARLRRAGRDRGAIVGERRRHQLVLEILLHDRLAHRLDGGAAGLVRPIDRLQGNLAISVPTLSQIAAEAAFEGRA